MTRVLLIALMTLAAASSEAQIANQPPVAKKVHTERTLNGATLTDDYAWLRERDNPDVKTYLEAENTYAEQMTASQAPVRQKLYDEIISHIKETDDTVPYLKDGYYYYTRTEKGKQYVIICRKKAPHADTPAVGVLGTPEAIKAPEQVLLDLNVMAEGQPFMSVGAAAVSDDGNWLAYTTDNVGFRQYKLHIRDLRTGKDLPDTAERVTSVAWTSDNKTLFYTVEDEVQNVRTGFIATLPERIRRTIRLFMKKLMSASTLRLAAPAAASSSPCSWAATPRRRCAFSRRRSRKASGLPSSRGATTLSTTPTIAATSSTFAPTIRRRRFVL